MSKIIARIVSMLLSPPIILFPAPFVLVFRKTHDFMTALRWTAISDVFLFIMIVFVMYGTYEGFFSNFDVSDKKERPGLFLGGTIVTLLYFISLVFLNAPKILIILVVGILFGIIVIGVLSNWFKTSIHTATISAFSLSLVILYGLNYLPALFLIPLMAWSRIKTKKHTPSEVLVGGIVGIVSAIIIYIIGKSFGL